MNEIQYSRHPMRNALKERCEEIGFSTPKSDLGFRMIADYFLNSKEGTVFVVFDRNPRSQVHGLFSSTEIAEEVIDQMRDVPTYLK